MVFGRMTNGGPNGHQLLVAAVRAKRDGVKSFLPSDYADIHHQLASNISRKRKKKNNPLQQRASAQRYVIPASK
jgi:hypothetical protein